MGVLSNNVKQELANVLGDKNEAMLVANGKLFTLEVHNTEQKIDSYPELKDSLQLFIDNQDMKRYAAKELKELRVDLRR